jgi:hypothetical protein
MNKWRGMIIEYNVKYVRGSLMRQELTNIKQRVSKLIKKDQFLILPSKE